MPYAMNEDVFPETRLQDGLLANPAMHFSADQMLKTDTLKRSSMNNSRVDLSRGDLIRLLSYLEGELQARDVVIATLKAEKAKQLLYQAKYGRLGLNDPLAALQRDSDSCGAKDDFDESSVGRMYESQLAQLERLISAQRRAHHRAKQVLSAAERRHARSIRELEQEKQRKAADAAQGDDVCMMLEKEREKLRHEIDYQKKEQEKLEQNLKKAREALEDENERHKAMVLYLMNDRKVLQRRLMEETQKSKATKDGAAGSASGTSKNSKVPQSASAQDVASTSKKADFSNNRAPLNKASLNTTSHISELADADKHAQILKDMERQMDAFRRERDMFKKQLESEREETASLKEIVRTQEEDLSLIRQNILAKTRQLAERTQAAQAADANAGRNGGGGTIEGQMPPPLPKVGPRLSRQGSGEQSRGAPPAYAGPQRPGSVTYRQGSSSSSSVSPNSPTASSASATALTRYSSSSSSHYATPSGLNRPSTQISGSMGPRISVGPSGTQGSLANRSTTPFPVNADDLRQVGIKGTVASGGNGTQKYTLPYQYASAGSGQATVTYGTAMGPGHSQTLPGLRTMSLGQQSSTKQPGITMVARPTILSGQGQQSSSSTFALKKQGSGSGQGHAPPTGYAGNPEEEGQTAPVVTNATYPGNMVHQQHEQLAYSGQGGSFRGPSSGRSSTGQYARIAVGGGQRAGSAPSQGNGSAQGQGARHQSGSASGSPQMVHLV